MFRPALIAERGFLTLTGLGFFVFSLLIRDRGNRWGFTRLFQEKDPLVF